MPSLTDLRMLAPGYQEAAIRNLEDHELLELPRMLATMSASDYARLNRSIMIELGRRYQAVMDTRIALAK